jgi:hypothetical protein
LLIIGEKKTPLSTNNSQQPLLSMSAFIPTEEREKKISQLEI